MKQIPKANPKNNVIFESNIIIEEPEPKPEGSDVTLGGISNIIDGVKESISDLKDTITGFFTEIKENNEFIKSLFGNNDLATALATKFWDSILERFNNFFSYIGDGFNLIKIIFNSLPEPLNYFIWVPFSLLILFGFFKKLL